MIWRRRRDPALTADAADALGPDLTHLLRTWLAGPPG
jgi:hypothetical protein